MMNYDVIVIGGGVAGYSAALKCLENGLKTAVVSKGQSALHFSSGSIDLLSKSPTDNQPVKYPLEEIERLKTLLPAHPYAKLGAENVEKAMEWYRSTMNNNGLPLSHLDSKANHYRITTMGSLKATWLSQPHVKQIDFDFESIKDIKRIIMISLEGFRDFQPQIAQDNLIRNANFKDIEIKTQTMSLTSFQQINRNPNEFRSIDISRILRNKVEFQEFANRLATIATPDDLVVLPSIMGNGDGLELMNRLKEYTNLTFHEVPTMPPSLLGIRLEDVMMNAFIRHGGSLLKGDEVIGNQMIEENGVLKLVSLETQKMGDIPINAKHFVLASGSFFSKGIVATRNKVIEPIFNLDMADIGQRSEWFQHDFFSKNPHTFLEFGVKTDKRFLPYLNGKKVSNLFCAGSILSGYNPVTHGCGCGVAISTAHYAIENILKKIKEEMLMAEVNS